MDTTASAPSPIDDEWVEHHFDYNADELAQDLHATLARARSKCPVTHSDAYGGYWVATDYEHVLQVAQDWQTYSSELGITPAQPRATAASGQAGMKIYPVSVDPPLQRIFKRLINAYFTASAVSVWEEPTRALVTELIDGFIESGECDFMDVFARPFPGLAFFDLALHAPKEDLAEVNSWATAASTPDAGDSMMKLAGWIGNLIADRRETGPRGDVVDAVIDAVIEGEPIGEMEMLGTITLLILGGLETTAGVLGMAMLRFCEHPEILDELRAHPEKISDAVEELLRLDGSFVCIGRTARHETELAGNHVEAGDPVLIYWAAANRDEAEFDHPDEFDLDRPGNRHLAFGAGPHRCAGSNLARMNLRVALEELVVRLHDVRLQDGADIRFHSQFNRAPLSVPITFTPGAPR
ncbi:MAG: cytochrome P450 [Acidimicrobiia bacterium]